MNKKALVLGLIPIFVVIPLLFGGLIAPRDPSNPKYPIVNPGLPGDTPTEDPRFVDPPPTLQFFSDTTHTNTTATLTAVATDYLNNAGIRWIRIYEDNQEWGYKDCQGMTTCTFVKVKVETQPANHTYYATTMDLGNHLVQSQSITIWFEGMNLPPIIDSYVPTDLTPDVNEGETLHFEVWAHDPNNDPLYYKWKLDDNQVSTTSSFDYNPDFNSSGFHTVYVIVYDNKGGEAVQTWNVTVINVLLNSTCYLRFNPQSPITYGTLLNASCYCTNPEAPARLWRDGSNIDDENGQFMLLGAGVYNYTCNVTQTQNYRNASNSSLYTINRANHTIHLALNGLEQNLTVQQGTQTNATGWLEIAQGVNGAALYRNGQPVAQGSPATEIATLPSGLYNYTYYYPQSQNYTQQTVTRWLNVSGKINSTCSLSFAPPSPITYDMQPFIALCSCTNPEAPAQLWRDGLNVTNEIGSPVTLAANPSGYNYVCNVTETQNYTNASNSSVYVINTGQTLLTLTARPSWNVIYPTRTNVSCRANNDQVALALTRNGLIVSNPDINTLGAGIYYYNCSTPGNQNWSAASVANTLNVSRAASLVNLTLNGVDGNITVNVNEQVNATGWLVIPFNSNQQNNSIIESIPVPQLYEIWLYMDGRPVGAGNYTVTYITSFPEPGLHNFTVRYPGTQNYSESNETHWVNVTLGNQPPQVILISPPNGSTLNTDNVTLEYSVIDEALMVNCSLWHNITGIWHKNQSAMVMRGIVNTFTAKNTPNGAYLWNVECNDTQYSIFAPYNWTFIVNVSGPDLIPPDVWNVSANPQIINQSQTTTLEAYARDNVAVDSVLAQVTYPDLTQVNFTMQPGLIVEQYLYNFTDTAQIGNYSVRIFANDTSNNWNTTETTWFIVQAIPSFGNTTTAIIQPANNSRFNLSQMFLTEANISAVGGDVVGCNATITFSNGTVLNTSQPVNVLGNIANGTTVVTQWNVTATAVGVSNITVTTTCLQGSSSSDRVYNITVTTVGDIEPPVIIFVPPTPINGSVINVTYVYVNTTITDNVAVDTAILSWNGINFTMAGTGPNYYLNMTSLADGLYIYRVFANDTSNNWNVSETRYVTVNTSIVNLPPVVRLVAPLNGTILPARNVTVAYNVTDDNTALLGCDIYSNTSGVWQIDGSQNVLNATTSSFNYTNLSNGAYLWNVECNDGMLSAFAPDNWTFIVNVSGPIVHNVGIDNNYSSSINGIRISYNGTPIMTDPATLNLTKNYELRARVNNYGTQPELVNNTYYLINATTRIMLYTEQVVVNAFTYPTYNWNVTGIAPGIYNITLNTTIIGAIDEDVSDNERNRTINVINETIPDTIPPWWLNESVTPPSPTVYGSGPYTFRIEWYDNVNVGAVYFQFNGVNYSATCVPALPAPATNCSYVFADLAAANHSYRWYARDTSNNWNQTSLLSYVVTQAPITGFLHLALNGTEGNLTVTYPTDTNATGWSDLNVPGIIYNLYRNNSLVATGDPASDIRTLGAGVYNYVYNTTGNQNYTSGSTPVRTLTVNQGTTVLTLNAAPSWNVTVGTQTNVTCAANNGEVLLNLYRNNSLVASGYNLVNNVATLPVGTYNYTCNTSGSQNWTAASISNTLIVSPLLPGDIRLWLNGTEGNLTVTYANEMLKFNASTLYGNVSIYRNGTRIAGPNASYTETFENLAAGYYNITAYSTGDANHSSATVTYFLAINKANSSLTLLLNGTNNDITIIEGQSVNHTAVLNTPTTGTLYLLRNGTQFAQGASPLTSINTYNNPGYYNITAYYNGSQNYSASQATHFITVLAAVHDVSVDNMWQVKINGRDNRTIYLNDLLNVSATVTNRGNVNESNILVNFTDTYMVGGNPVTVVIGTQTISLNNGSSQVVSFNYTAVPKGVHTLRIRATVNGDINTSNDYKTIDLVVWSVNDIVSNDTREIFVDNTNPPLNTIFNVYLPVQNNFASQEFFDFPTLLTITPNNLLPLDPMQGYNYLAPGGFVVVQWRVNATAPGLHNIGAVEGVNELTIPSKQINVIP
ncbi:MAG: hypothetical protein K6T73_08400 [Candidatus Bathyarchaeota archaeon]|nr:hypothetical protein [Candidatus Bathyarchaeota archaeon]